VLKCPFVLRINLPREEEIREELIGRCQLLHLLSALSAALLWLLTEYARSVALITRRRSSL
jgi:hypothetical protein